ncbi:hypothetical protein F444_14661 [Phytophthora nicotianae P1976]|uniref:Uncharacterized protein n=1 Tax=Phytophthora nicotianae P1976 TaxID=1317066 RepID=A0A080ZPE9_PHYNI|nr:hypothetical protein F444_14661 [Phytophthora nicotianae P1976]
MPGQYDWEEVVKVQAMSTMEEFSHISRRVYQDLGRMQEF